MFKKSKLLLLIILLTSGTTNLNWLVRRYADNQVGIVYTTSTNETIINIQDAVFPEGLPLGINNIWEVDDAGRNFLTANKYFAENGNEYEFVLNKYILINNHWCVIYLEEEHNIASQQIFDLLEEEYEQQVAGANAIAGAH